MSAVSVIIPTYNHGALLPATLDSVFAQTFPDTEIIVVNDASPDDTAERLRPLAASGRIRVIEQSVNGGQASARNRGIAEATGEFLALLDDDDLWPPDKLAWQVAALRARPEIAVVYGRAERMDAQGAPMGDAAPSGRDDSPFSWPADAPDGDMYAAFARRNWIISPGQCLLRRSAVLEVSEAGAAFDPAIWGADDWDLWLRLAERGPFLFVDRPALRYRMHAENASRDHFRLDRNALAVYEKHLRRNRDTRPKRFHLLQAGRDAFRRHLPARWLAQARREIRRGNAARAGVLVLAVLRLGPRCLLDEPFRKSLRRAVGLSP